jgi:glutathione S-transferase
MTSADLAFFSGSPFARMTRLLVREWALPVEERELPFPPPPDLFDTTPMGQVPVLRIGAETLFPTLIVMERLWEMASRPPAYDPGRDRQRLLVTLQMGDALVAALYIGWTGLRPTGPNHIGYDLAARHMERMAHTLDWLEAGAGAGHVLHLPDVALACLVLWSEARGGPARPFHPRIDAAVGRLAARPSFQATLPPAWRPGQ